MKNIQYSFQKLWIQIEAKTFGNKYLKQCCKYQNILQMSKGFINMYILCNWRTKWYL